MIHYSPPPSRWNVGLGRIRQGVALRTGVTAFLLLAFTFHGIVFVPGLLAQSPPSEGKASAKGGGSKAPPSSRRLKKLPEGSPEPSDAFVEDWVPPAPSLTPKDVQRNRAAKVVGPDFSRLNLPERPKKGEFERTHVLGNKLQASPNGTLTQQDATSLKTVLERYMEAGGQSEVENVSLLEDFLETRGTSAFRASLLLEIGDIYRKHGYFLRAQRAWKDAWESTKSLPTEKGKRLSEEALKKYVDLTANLGMKDEIDTIVTELKDRKMEGLGAEARYRALRAQYFFNHQAEQNIFCGFTALNEVCVPLGKRPVFPDVHDEAEEAEFIANGLSLFELREHSHETGGDVRLVKRTDANVELPVPSVVHWNFNHYSALVAKSDEGSYRVKDVHLKFDAWVSPEAMEEQISGYFAVPGDWEMRHGFVEVSDKEAQQVFGRHCSHDEDEEEDDCEDDAGAGGTGCETCPPPENSSSCDDKEGGGDEESCPMATYSFNFFRPGLIVSDTPIAYQPNYGPSVSFKLTYAQRTSIDHSQSNVSNFGPLWSYGLLSYVELTGNGTPNTQVQVVRGDGNYTTFSHDSGGVYTGQYQNSATLRWLDAAQGGPGFSMNYPGGTVLYFKQADGPTPTRYFLSSIEDSYSNAVTLSYDTNLRLIQVTDATGGAVTLSYTPDPADEVQGDIYKIRSISDPWGRTVDFRYHSSGKLKSIVDPVGIESSFTYTGSFMSSLTTPYGTTSFRTGELAAYNDLSDRVPGRWVEAEDENGDVERVEKNENIDFPRQDANEQPLEESPMAPGSVNVDGQAVSFLPKTDNLHFRNTYYWDKEAYHHNGLTTAEYNDGDGDYSTATIRNFLAINDKIVGVLGSIKRPLEGRVWYNYPGQTSSHSPGTSNRASKVVRAVEKPGGGHEWIMAQRSYNAFGLVTESIDPLGRKTRNLYHPNNMDVHHVQVWENGAWQTVESIPVYENHKPKTITTSSGITTTHTYNTYGQLTATTTTDGSETHTTTYQYNATTGFLESVIRDGVTVATYTDDGFNRVRTATDIDGYTLTYDYDEIDRVTQITHPDATTEQLIYEDEQGVKMLGVTASKDREDRWTRVKYDVLRQPTHVLDSKGQYTVYEWCRCGDLRKLYDAKGQITHWIRDVQGRVVDKIYPGGKRSSLTYQPLSGRVASSTQPDDQGGSPTVSYQYNLAGQTLLADYSDASMDDVSYTYADDLGRMTGMTDGIGNTIYTYHPLNSNGAGQLHTLNGPWANDTVSYRYDDMGRMDRREIQNDDQSVSAFVEYRFDTLGRVDRITDNLGVHEVTAFDGDTSRPLNSVSKADETSNPILQRAYGYTNVSAGKRLQSITNTNGSSNAISSFDYTYTPNGQIKTWTRNLGTSGIDTWTMDYDPAYQLEGVTVTDDTGAEILRYAYGYDAAGNRTGETIGTSAAYASHNVRNQLTKVGGVGATTVVEGTVDEPSTVKVNGEVASIQALSGGTEFLYRKEIDVLVGANTFTVEAEDGSGNIETKTYSVTVSGEQKILVHDANGNLLTEEDIASGKTRQYEWDALNRLLAVQSSTTPGIGDVRIEYGYDGLGRRVSRSKKSWAPGTGEWTTDDEASFFWCGTELCQKRNAAGDSVLASYSGFGQERGAEKLYYNRDHLGSVREVVSTGGAVMARYDYDPWGRRTKLEGATDVEFGFTGHHYDPDVDLHLTLFRAYDQNLGRWLSPDPIGESGGLNLYGYVGNDPVNFFDIFGLSPDGAPASWPTPPTSIPGGPWKWAPDPQNSRGGTLRPINPPSGQSCPTLSWSPPTSNAAEGNPKGYWKHNDGRGNTQRYSPTGQRITPSQAHPGRPENSKKRQPKSKAARRCGPSGRQPLRHYGKGRGGYRPSRRAPAFPRGGAGPSGPYRSNPYLPY
ncbi:MAG: hypothetical protein MI807_08785 [Verrucomicrobiales bacterium]|nr:hypothetical protein [Verrucomicrobiales bacterium]